MTLREFQSSADMVSRFDSEENRVPSVQWLRESGIPVLSCEHMDTCIEVTGYKNGFVIYRNDKYATVFSIHDCL